MKHPYKLTFALLTLCLFLGASLWALPVQAATLTVDNTNGSCSDSTGTPYCTIGAAILAANPGDTIHVSASTYHERLTISKNLTLLGTGTTATIVNGDAAGNVISVTVGTTASITKFNIQNGTALHGGGIYNAGTLSLTNCTITGNTATNGTTSGGGIYNTGVLNLTSSSVISNTAANTLTTHTADGGGITIDKGGTLTVFNSTVSGNVADRNGGGIYLSTSATNTLTLINTTITNNTANNASVLPTPGDGGGLDIISGTVSLKNTIIARNTQLGGSINGVYDPDCSGPAITWTSFGYNLIGMGGAPFGCPIAPATGDLMGAGPFGTNPQLGPLQNNGGTTLTQALLFGSPAINKGSCTDISGSPVTTDQRGVSRPQNGACDVGAFEFNGSAILYYDLPLIEKSK